MLHREKPANREKSENKSLLLFGIVSLLWFIFRTGTKPSRITYPCQRAALINGSALLGFSIPISMVAISKRTRRFLSKRGTILLLFIAIVSMLLSDEQFLRVFQPVSVANPNQDVQLILESRNATESPASDIYVANGRAYAHIGELINLMGSHGLLFYKSSTVGVNHGPDGLIARDDVVLIKINEQWPYRGGTNTDVLKELIQAIIGHPEGFAGEIVVADNGQGIGSMDWTYGNAEDVAQSTQVVVDMFSSSYNVSAYDWQTILNSQVDEYSEGDMEDGYILYNVTDPETGIDVSYPKFRTGFGSCISFKNGIWNGTGYEARLKVINMPVLKSHQIYGVTASVKHYMGVQSEGSMGGLGNGHSCVATGGMGTLMVETGLPTLNIIDAIWINAHPWPSALVGPNTFYFEATRVNVLMASIDAVALDYWAAKHVLVKAANVIGYDDTHTLDPDNTDRDGLSEAFGVWLNLTRNEIVAAGYNVTTNENHMNVYVSQDETAPIIQILSPENRTYPVPNASLIFTVNEPTGWMGYSLDDQTNLTITGNTTLTGLFEGSHYVVVYANDTIGNMGGSRIVHLTIDTIPPNITDVSQEPLSNEVLPQDEVKVNATITDSTSGVKRATLVYACSNNSGTWIKTVEMTNLEENIWNATIPAFPYGTNVTYVVIAADKAGNQKTTEEMVENRYQVIPEFRSLLILPLFMAATLLAAIVHRRKHTLDSINE